MQLSKKIALPLVIAALLSGLLSTSAQAATFGVTATPSTDLQTGSQVVIDIQNLADDAGIYALLCKDSGSPMAVPTLCDQERSLWITSNPSLPANTGSTASGTAMTVSSSFLGKVSRAASESTPVDCLIDTCVVYIRGDHNNSTNFGLIRILPLTFVGGGELRETDSATAQYGNITLRPNQPGNLTYRTPINLVVTATSGLAVSLVSLNGNCAIVGNQVSALTGVGVCAIGASTLGNDEYEPLTVNFPFYLNKLRPTITAQWPTFKNAKVGGELKIAKSKIRGTQGVPVNLFSNTRTACVVENQGKSWVIKYKSTETCWLTAKVYASSTAWTSTVINKSFAIKAKN
jgi:hypothetical protein